MHRTRALEGRLEYSTRRCTSACHHTTGARPNHPSEVVWALDGGHHGGIEDLTARGLDPGTSPGDNHDLHAVGVILAYAPNEPCLL